jgi:hypothetical protein
MAHEMPIEDGDCRGPVALDGVREGGEMDALPFVHGQGASSIQQGSRRDGHDRTFCRIESFSLLYFLELWGGAMKIFFVELDEIQKSL